jgi:hypothetical protein
LPKNSHDPKVTAGRKFDFTPYPIFYISILFFCYTALSMSLHAEVADISFRGQFKKNYSTASITLKSKDMPSGLYKRPCSSFGISTKRLSC